MVARSDRVFGIFGFPALCAAALQQPITLTWPLPAGTLQQPSISHNLHDAIHGKLFDVYLADGRCQTSAFPEFIPGWMSNHGLTNTTLRNSMVGWRVHWPIAELMARGLVQEDCRLVQRQEHCPDRLRLDRPPKACFRDLEPLPRTDVKRTQPEDATIEEIDQNLVQYAVLKGNSHHVKAYDPRHLLLAVDATANCSDLSKVEKQLSKMLTFAKPSSAHTQRRISRCQ